ncbi:hypothetical protein pipiens_000466, partial [Culex pipiens pipiens]
MNNLRKTCDDHLRTVFADTIDNRANAEDLFQLEHKSLEYQIKMLLKLMNHFEVARSSSCERFPYKFKVFESIEANPNNKQMIEQANKAFGCQRKNNSLLLPDELHVWICLLDDTIAQLFANNQQIKKLSSDLFRLFFNFVLSGQMTVDSMESLRVLTHNTIRFIAQAGPIIKPENDQGNDILEKQIAYMNRALLEGRMSFENYRDLIEVFAEYWVQRSDVTDGSVVKRPEQCIEQNENELKSQLLQCMASALDKNVQVVDLIKFCRVYDELLVDLRNLPLEWFVRLPTEDYNDIFIKKNALSIVQNKWMGKILAGLSAVWALHVSRDMASTGQYLKPHCIQILCVFRLLSADREDEGVRKHLAQVLTGQGKSLVLALVASVLALCGHSVQIMCYIKYLATRDGKEFEDFYDLFGIHSKISYQTFEEAAKERLNQIAGNATHSYEKKVVTDHYNITEMTVMPSFFGGSNLKFNETVDFNCFNTATEWTNAIFGRINVTVNAKRSVLVIFNSDVEINGFKQQFAAQLDRLNVLTVDTDPADKERFISDAGVSRTITLATREMGRGVDYKSSVAVEKNGGVHVIQSFFSKDVKEETQIKGRTARKDNRGSYELIVCVDDLRKENFVDSQESYLTVTIEHQFKLLLKLINHFEVGRSTSHHRFPYTFKVFVDVESNANQKDIAMLPDELHVWICLLDDTIAQLFSNDQHVVEMCSALLKPYMNYSLSGQITSDLLESLRVTTHNTIRFVAQAGPFANPQNEQDNELLLKQIGFMNRTSLEGRMSFEDYRDLIEVFAQYWRQRSEASEGFLTKLSGESLKQHVEEIQSLLLKCMAGALDKRVELTELVNFCRVYDELLSYLHNLPMEWFVRMPSEENTEIFIEKGILQLVENKWMDSDKQCYCVKDVKQFEKLFHVLFDKQELPRNFLVESIKTLLKCIVDLETKERWSNDKALTESEQLNATGLCITTVRSSLLYLKEQPDYISFDQFLEESTKPFTNVSNESNSFEDFEKRVLLIKESFWYIRNMNAIDIDTALKLYKNLNKADYKEDRLRSAYEIYIKQFAQFMTIDSNLSTSSRIENIVKDTSQMVEDSITSNWTVKFKQEKLPKILAGLAAVWALHVSKDVAITGQYLKPHCIQILCVFRLLSVDREDPGVRKHLAQVLTGQGKSLVLAMVAAVLALCGHSVQVMCYSKYLTTRDGKDFEDFYGFFGVRSKITYQTFEEAARTLTTISTYEKKVVKDHYHINEMSVMPSFFGGSNLKFNATQDFRCLNTVNEWMNAIFGRINTIINAKRSVLVVFDTDLKIYAFKQQFAAQLDRLNVLTIDTNLADKERFINDAGVSRTITLSTREMGRGVDYKSSVAVEKNGGMHVIQSFFSVDVKEETQIKGRTARKDNRGSYELILLCPTFSG